MAGGFFRLAFTPAFYRRSKAQKKKIIALLRTERRDITLKELETRIKYGITAAHYEEYRNLKDIHPTEDIKKAFGQWHTLFMERVRETERLKETA